MHYKFIISLSIIIAFTLGLFLFFNHVILAAQNKREIFTDQLAPDFSNWSWSSSVNLNNTESVYAGTKSIAFSLEPWGALYLHTSNPIQTNQYSSLQFVLRPTQTEPNLKIQLYDTTNQPIKMTIPLSKYSANPTLNQWTTYTIPLTDFSNLPAQITGFALQDTTGKAQPQMYIDNISFMQNPSLSNTATIYADSLDTKWMNWSWDSQLDLQNTYPTFEGNNSLSLTITKGWGGLYLHTDTPIDANQYSWLTFAAKASQEQQQYAVLLFDQNNQIINQPLPLNTYSGQPVSSTWKMYEIPLSDLNPLHKPISGIGLFDLTGNAQPKLYLDDIAFTTTHNQTTSSSPVMSSAPTISASITPSIVPTIISTISSTISPAISPTASILGKNPLAGKSFFNNPDTNPAATTAQQWQSSRPQDAAMLEKIATQPKAIWMGNWNNNIQSDTQTIINKASQTNTVPVFIAYNIPNRDCGSYSAGGSNSTQAYEDWISNFAAGIGNKPSVVILEPDALAQISCLPNDAQQQRLDLLKYATQKLKSLGNTSVYLDAGHSGWISPNDISQSLKNAGVDMADGFALNVSNFDTTTNSITYGQQIAAQTGGKHFVLDTSRNGNGPSSDNEWCNPPGRALGNNPTTQTDNSLVDAYLWLKYPGESDGSCNGAPSAGTWYPDYALGLAQRAK